MADSLSVPFWPFVPPVTTLPILITQPHQGQMIEKETVEGWLRQARIDFEDVEDKSGDYEWMISFRSGSFATYAAYDASWDSMLLQVSLGVSPEHGEALAEAEDGNRERFLHDLRIELLKLPVGFLIQMDESEGLPERLVFVLNVLEEPVQRSGFFRRAHQLQSAAMLAAEMFKKFARFRQWS